MKLRALTLLALVGLIGWGGFTSPAQARQRSSTAANKAMVHAFFEEVFNQGKIDMADKYIAVDAVWDHQKPPGAPQGLAGFKADLTKVRSALPDLHVTIEDVIAEGDKVVVRSTLHGTQTGEIVMGPDSRIPATGKAITGTAIDIMRFAGGKMVEHWSNEDDLGMLQQLGVRVTPPAAAPAAPSR